MKGSGELESQLEGYSGVSNLGEKLSELVSGFRGYENRALRTESEKRLRKFLEERLVSHKKELYRLCEVGYDAELASGIRNLLDKVDSLLDMIRFPKYRYTSFFDVNEIDAKKLEHIYNIEVNLIGELCLMEERIDNIRFYDGMVTDQFNELFKLNSQTILIERKLQEKERVLQEVA